MPAVPGVNETLIVVDCPGWRVMSLASLNESPKDDALVPPMEVLSTTMAGSPAAPRFVRVTVRLAD